jgi:hypothetical protein
MTLAVVVLAVGGVLGVVAAWFAPPSPPDQVAAFAAEDERRAAEARAMLAADMGRLRERPAVRDAYAKLYDLLTRPKHVPRRGYFPAYDTYEATDAFLTLEWDLPPEERYEPIEPAVREAIDGGLLELGDALRGRLGVGDEPLFHPTAFGYVPGMPHGAFRNVAVLAFESGDDDTAVRAIAACFALSLMSVVDPTPQGVIEAVALIENTSWIIFRASTHGHIRPAFSASMAEVIAEEVRLPSTPTMVAYLRAEVHAWYAELYNLAEGFDDERGPALSLAVRSMPYADVRRAVDRFFDDVLAASAQGRESRHAAGFVPGETDYSRYGRGLLLRPLRGLGDAALWELDRRDQVQENLEELILALQRIGGTTPA